RKRIARIRVFDPACGSGNFLVIAYKELRAIEAEINRRRGEDKRPSDIPLTNFRGIELRDFSAEIARLALVIAEYQCDERYRGRKLALAEFLPLRAENWITCGNALRLDWLSICPPTGTGVRRVSDDLLETPLDQPEIDFENEGGETYICGNPPYRGSSYQTPKQKSDLESLFAQRTASWKNFDYIAGWFLKAADFCRIVEGSFAFVSTNSICQGQQVPMLWPLIFGSNQEISFAHTSFKWANLASHNAGVTVIVVGVSRVSGKKKKLYFLDQEGQSVLRQVDNINAYLVPASDAIVQSRSSPLCEQSLMLKGNQPTDGGNLCLSPDEAKHMLKNASEAEPFLFKYLGSRELIRGEERYCLWISDEEVGIAQSIPQIAARLDAVAKARRESKAPTTRPFADFPHRFRQIQDVGNMVSIVVPSVSSEAREFLPVGMVGPKSIISNLAFAIYDSAIWNMALIASRVHLVWIATVCGKLKTDFRYSNTLGWNTFPVPTLTEKNKTDLTRCAEDILLTRERHFPATIADLYDPNKMPDDLRAAHDRNDEVLERIYIGRRFKNDTERLEKLFDLYTKMTTTQPKRGATR
uniref:class I SAM-dependent DNA methyltransferase n=1 Tax=uncultured Thiohalocapsa sp. TaxID=768990 RepID=UPI00345A9305